MDELLIDRRHGSLRISAEEREQVIDFSEGYKGFIDAGKTERECVKLAVAAAEAAGFVPFDPGAKYKAGDKIYYNNRGKALCLAVIGSSRLKKGARIAAAHIDSPRLDLKPMPLYEKNEQALLKTHYYGGIKKYQWTAIPLAMHGTIIRKDGSSLDICIGEAPGDPQFCITDLLPHLGKDQSAKKLGEAIPAEDLNILVGSLPDPDENAKEAYKSAILKLLNQKYHLVEEDLISAEIEFVPAFPAADVGLDRSLIGAYGHDDRVCAYPALEAILRCSPKDQTVITVLADKEEIGSMGNTGLASDFLRYFITDLAAQEGLEGRHVLSRSSCLSADVTAAYDPNFASAYDATNSCYLNHGLGVMKYTGSRGKSGSSDASAEFVGQIRKIFNDNRVLWQVGELGRVDQGFGATVALELATMNIDVIDVGVPVLSMHAPWEVVSKLDVFMTFKGIKSFFEM